MLFNSIDFLVFFPIVVILYYVFPYKIRTVWLLICSYYFYMSWNPKYAALIFLSTVTTFSSGICIKNIVLNEKISLTKQNLLKKICLICSLLINLGILLYFKYANFALEIIEKISGLLSLSFKAPQLSIILPVGISFYTFQALGYSIDVYRDVSKVERNFIKYALFVSFFPQLVAGPIERSKKLLSQINKKHEFRYENVRDGLMLMLWGLFLKMVISDRIAVFVDKIYGDYNTYKGVYLIVAAILFAIQIYCDFSGYSVIAVGAARVMGFELTDNFNAPYFSRTVSEFWRRWHISLFGWFKDYIYFPLGGSKKGKIRKYINIMIVFLISGIWHGASFTFIVWGGLNGLYQVIGDMTRGIRQKITDKMQVDINSFSHRVLQTLVTFLLIVFSFIFFRSDGLLVALDIIKSIVVERNYWILFDGSLYTLGLNQKNFTVMIVSILVLFFADYNKAKGIVIRNVIKKQGIWFRFLVLLLGIASIFIFGIWGSLYSDTAFIYFDF